MLISKGYDLFVESEFDDVKLTEIRKKYSFIDKIGNNALKDNYDNVDIVNNNRFIIIRYHSYLIDKKKRNLYIKNI